MHLQTRRVFRLSATMALSLAAGYALNLQLPYLAPIFALVLTAKPAPPLSLKKLLVLLLVIVLTLNIGLLLIPLVVYYPLPALLLVALGLYASFVLMVNKGKMLPGMFLAIGLTLISAAGALSSLLAEQVIESMAIGIVIAVVCHWLVSPLFPEDPGASASESETPPEQSNWVALRATLIMMPAYILALSNPTLYMAVLIKSVSLSQQGSLISVRSAGRELIGSTFLAGCFAMAFWLLLGLATNLWMFFLWTLLFSSYFAAKIYGVMPSRYSPSFWQSVAITMLILLGSTVTDSNNGEDVYTAFFTRMSLFIAVTLYAWLTACLLESWRKRRIARQSPESLSC